ncbi:ORC ubiquitin ligase 1 [Pelodytes ibericus]
MAQCVQNVTLALTLPITCHICLGKVRQPVICPNHHVFCSVCIELWLKKNNQCPACRVPITPEHPCKDIIGGTSENECMLSHSVRTHLRKARFELLHKEYEDEIELLLKETDELKRTNINLEEKLNEHVDSRAMSSPCKCNTRRSEDKNGTDARTLEELSKKLLAASDTIRKVTEDTERLKEENKKLRVENIDFGRENLRLKGEVIGRSPQKFGRFTVAALQAKIDQYEREMNRLRKALERSDQYIEELEGQVEQLKQPAEVKQKGKSEEDGTAVCWQEVNLAEIMPNKKHGSCEGTDQREKDSELTSNDCMSSVNPVNVFTGGTYSLNLQKQICSSLNEHGSNNDIAKSPFQKDKPDGAKSKTCTPSKERELLEYSSPSTSLLPFGSLQLNTPDNKVSHAVKETSMKKPLTYLRKLVFDDFRKKGEPTSLASGIREGCLRDKTTDSNSLHMNSQVDCETHKGPNICERKELVDLTTNQGNQCLTQTCQDINGHVNRSRSSSQDSMDAAYFDKVNELDSMMSELENAKSTSDTSVTSQALSSSENTTLPNEQNNTMSKNASCLQPRYQPWKDDPQSAGSFSCFSSPIGEHQQNLESKPTKQLQSFDLQSAPSFIFPKQLHSSKDHNFLQSSSDKIASGNQATASTSSYAHYKNENCSPVAKRKLLSMSTDSPPKFPKH